MKGLETRTMLTNATLQQAAATMNIAEGNHDMVAVKTDVKSIGAKKTELRPSTMPRAPKRSPVSMSGPATWSASDAVAGFAGAANEWNAADTIYKVPLALTLTPIAR